jgi:hypothetical protein
LTWRVRAGFEIAEPREWDTHCDVVTEVRPGQIRVIGGNVGQTVAAKPLETLPDGRLRLTGAQRRFFAVVQCRSPATSPPAPASGPGPAGMDARVLRLGGDVAPPAGLHLAWCDSIG